MPEVRLCTCLSRVKRCNDVARDEATIERRNLLQGLWQQPAFCGSRLWQALLVEG